MVLVRGGGEDLGMGAGVLNLTVFADAGMVLEGGAGLGGSLVVSLARGGAGAGAGESKKEKSAEAQGSRGELLTVVDGAEKGAGDIGAIVVRVVDVGGPFVGVRDGN